MTLLLLGLVLFLGVHSVAIVAPAWRDAQARRLGGRWQGLYAVLAALGLVAIVVGYGQARQAPVLLYVPPTGLRHLAWTLMLPVFPLLLAAYLPGRIQAAVRHPMLVATLLWATAHLLANGTAADLALFGGFLAWALADLVSLARRPARPKAELPRGRWNDLIAVVGGLALYGLTVGGLHLWLFGVSPRG
ncbi:NnrU family protein [Piscinibacter sakaiensis]|uniref:NnrU family protein n=1 Tax=Piscinibacter sakaiensis TaxID=1547922 RepID=A0A0K8P350_PISS1|nr:NnrU family protein [Piscinibacter sakaiensis]GAP37092.1 NnrU family protein [Piscinibacter sakaiensis]